ncbi:MAG: InaA protein [Deltaproteobacteria bacterium]|nr:MAG: InaA protein [Deltaproteobacteria bacterium]
MRETLNEEFHYWWQASGEWVEPQNFRRGGTSGVIRHIPEHGPTLYIKRQEGHIFRSLRYPFGRPTCLREAQALERFQAMGFCVPALRFFAVRKKGTWHGVLVTETLPEGFISLENFYPSAQALALSDPERERIIKKMASTLANLHRQRWQHSSLMPKHIFIRLTKSEQEAEPVKVEIAFLDLERARRQPTAKRASTRDLHFMRKRLLFWSEEDWLIFDHSYRLAFR